MKKKIDLSIILPIHRDDKMYESFIKYVYSTLNHKKINFEVLCINNSSRDKSNFILKKIASKHANMRVLNNKISLGSIIKNDIKEVSGEYICYLDVKTQISAKYILILYNKIKNEKLPMAKISRVFNHNSLLTIGLRIYNIFIHYLFSINSSDINGTPKIFNRKLTKHIHFLFPNYTFDLELLLWMKANNITCIEIPAQVSMIREGISISQIRSVFKTLYYTLLIRFFRE